MKILTTLLVASVFTVGFGTVLAQAKGHEKPFESRVIQVGAKPVTGPIAPGVKVGDHIWVSGQVPLSMVTGKVPTTFDEQAKQALENVKAVLEAGGSSMEDVVKVTILLNNLDNYDAMNKIYATYFTKNFPARICYEVPRLPLGVMVEIDAMAVKR